MPSLFIVKLGKMLRATGMSDYPAQGHYSEGYHFIPLLDVLAESRSHLCCFLNIWILPRRNHMLPASHEASLYFLYAFRGIINAMLILYAI